MSDKDTIFKDGDTPPETPPDTVTPPKEDFSGLLTTITNETGQPKYATVETALASITPANDHIKKLEDENAKLRDSLVQSTTLDSVVEALNSSQSTDQTTTDAGLSADDVAGLVNNLLNQHAEQSVAVQNAQEVVSWMTEKFGTTGEEVFYGKAKELGMSAEQLNQMAKNSPKVVKALFNDAPKQDLAITGDVNTATLTGKPNPDAKPQSVMGGHTTAQLMTAWDAAAPKTET